MPIRTSDPVLRFGQQLATESSLTEELGATWRESVSMSPLGSILRMMELNAAQSGQGQSASSVARFGYLPNVPQASPMLSRDDALTRIRDEGLEGALNVPETGIRSGALDILIRRKQEENRRNVIRVQSPGGGGRFAANLFVGFAGQLVDPLNVGASFIPVVGQERYAAMLARAGSLAGRTGVRAGVGAVEGTVGAAIVEPFNYYANLQQQADYDAFDSAINIAGGAFFGSALHGGAGLFGDMIRQPRQFEHVPIAETPTAPGLQRPVFKAPEVDPRELALQRERTIVLDRLAEGRPLTRGRAIAQARETFREDIESALIARAGNASDPGVVAASKAELKVIDRELTALETERRETIKQFNARPSVTRKQAETLADKAIAERRIDLEGRKARAETQIAVNKDAATANEQLSAFRKGEIPEEWRAQVEQEADRLLGGDGSQTLSKAVTDAIEADRFATVRPFLAQLPQSTQESMFRMALAQAITGRPIDVSPGLFAHYKDINAAADAAMRNAQEVAGADHIASQMADARIKQAKEDLATLKEQAAEEEAILREQAKAAGLDIEDMMAEAADAAAMAKAQAEAVKIATLCMLRNG